MVGKNKKKRKLGEKQKAKGQKVCPRPMKRLDQEVLAYSKWSVVWGFSEQLERLRKKLALEEGRIFAANEQLNYLSFRFYCFFFLYVNINNIRLCHRDMVYIYF